MTIKDIRPALRTFLLADAGIAAATLIAGSSPAKWNVYPVKMPQGVSATSIVYNRISGLGDLHNEGPSGLTRPRIQIDCWATSHDAAVVLANLVKERLDGYKGMMGSVDVQGVIFESERDVENATITPALFGLSRDYFFWYEER